MVQTATRDRWRATARSQTGTHRGPLSVRVNLGVWAGTTPGGRARLRRRGEDACEACKAAQRDLSPSTTEDGHVRAVWLPIALGTPGAEPRQLARFMGL